MIIRNALIVAVLLTGRILAAGEEGLKSSALQGENYFDFEEKRFVFCVRNSSLQPVVIIRDTLPWMDLGMVLFDVFDYETKRRDKEWGSSIFITPATVRLPAGQVISEGVRLEDIVSANFIRAEDGRLLIRWSKTIMTAVDAGREEVVIGNWVLIDFKEETNINGGRSDR